MGIKKKKNLILLLGFFIILSNCTKKEIDGEKLCVKFLELNKDKKFEVLFDVAIGGGRGKSIYDESTNQYEYIFNSIDVYDSREGKFLMIPIFKRNATLSEKEVVFKNLSSEAKNYILTKYGIDSNYSSEIFNSYINFTELVLTKYYDIETPKELGFKNISIEGYPPSGKFITFSLNDTCKVYYLEDDSLLTNYWKKYFGTLNKYDKNWYYEVVI